MRNGIGCWASTPGGTLLSPRPDVAQASTRVAVAAGAKVGVDGAAMAEGGGVCVSEVGGRTAMQPELSMSTRAMGTCAGTLGVCIIGNHTALAGTRARERVIRRHKHALP